jgi:hypothetical protein
MRLLGLSLLACCTIPLGGCVPMMAANAAGKVGAAVVGPPESNMGMEPMARADCSTRAQGYGTVHIINVERHSPSTIVVWGTTQNETGRQSFKCVYGKAIRSFTLRRLPPQAG